MEEIHTLVPGDTTLNLLCKPRQALAGAPGGEGLIRPEDAFDRHWAISEAERL